MFGTASYTQGCWTRKVRQRPRSRSPEPARQAASSTFPAASASWRGGGASGVGDAFRECRGLWP